MDNFFWIKFTIPVFWWRVIFFPVSLFVSRTKKETWMQEGVKFLRALLLHMRNVCVCVCVCKREGGWEGGSSREWNLDFCSRVKLSVLQNVHDKDFSWKWNLIQTWKCSLGKKRKLLFFWWIRKDFDILTDSKSVLFFVGVFWPKNLESSSMSMC